MRLAASQFFLLSTLPDMRQVHLFYTVEFACISRYLSCMLQMPSSWRFGSPGPLPPAAVSSFNELVHKIAAQGETWNLIELFKAKFAGSWSRSSTESWATSDLHDRMLEAAANAPVFIAAFWSGCEEVAGTYPDVDLPGPDVINRILYDHGLPYEVRPPALILSSQGAAAVTMPPMPDIGERARSLIDESLREADRLLSERRPRQAVQEILWLLETVSTGFQGQETESGTIEGKYFNKIVGELRREHREKPLAEALGWIVKLHGFLSSPTGGGVRHGTQLDAAVEVAMDEALLYCNLTKSYVHYLLAILDQHGRTVANTSTSEADNV